MITFTPQELNPYSRGLHEEALASAKKYLVVEAELLAAIIEIDLDETYKKLRYEHLTPYCMQELKLSEEVAGTFVRVARKCIEVPKLSLAVNEGLHLTKAKTIASVLTFDNQDEWIGKAQSLSKRKLEREVAVVNPSPFQKEKAKPVGENRNRLEFEVDDETMALEQRAQDLVSGKLGRTAALAEVQKYLLKSFIKHEDPVAKADRSKSHRSRERSSENSSYRSPPRESIPAAIKHAVHRRDHGLCQAKTPDGTLCLKERWVQLHHVLPKAQGGLDTAENLITLCSSHHRLWHEQWE
jgi:5-methylcytosine-specific restriction endonuclease McrA